MPDLTESLQYNMQEILSHNTPLLPREELHDFIKFYFDRREYYLEILSNHPAPIYLQESLILKERANRFKTAFKNTLPDTSFYFAIKSNNHPDIAKILIDSGYGIDVSSGLELEMALALNATDIIFSGPGKTAQELHLATANADRVVILLDSFGELESLGAITTKRGVKMRCGVRLTVDPNGLWRKFGVNPDLLSTFWDEAKKHKNIDLIGLQFHSSWNLSPTPQILFIQRLGRNLSRLSPALRNSIEFIDIGGGYWPSQGEWVQSSATNEGKLFDALGYDSGSHDIHYRLPATCIEEFANDLGREIRKNLLKIIPCHIFLEPGRWLCNDAVHIMISVVDKKAPDLVITDAGTNTVGWERFESDYFPVLNLTRPSLEEKKCHILGSLCTPHDVWGYMYFGKDIQTGDILMIPTQGAYTYSLRQNFIKPLPEVVTI